MNDEKNSVPVWEKTLLTVEEASKYTGIGTGKLYQLAEADMADCVIWVGKKKLFKRKKLEQFFDKAFSV